MLTFAVWNSCKYWSKFSCLSLKFPVSLCCLYVQLVLVHCGNNMKYINTPCIQNAQDFNVKECGICNYQCRLNVQLQKAVEFFLTCWFLLDFPRMQDVNYRLTQNLELRRDHCPCNLGFQAAFSMLLMQRGQSVSRQSERPGRSLLLLITLTQK